MSIEIKICSTCDTLKKSAPTPDGDENCPNCGDIEMMDYEEEYITKQTVAKICEMEGINFEETMEYLHGLEYYRREDIETFFNR